MEIDREHALPGRRPRLRLPLGDPAPARSGRGALGPPHRRALRGRLRLRVISIEHEDRAFEGTEELVKRGFYLSRDVLAAVHRVMGGGWWVIGW